MKYYKFELNEEYEVDRSIPKCVEIRYSQSQLSTINTVDSKIKINIPTENSGNSLLNSSLDLNFDVLDAATGNCYADGNDKRLVNLGPIDFFSSFELETSSLKHIKVMTLAHIVSFLYKLVTSAR